MWFSIILSGFVLFDIWGGGEFTVLSFSYGSAAFVFMLWLHMRFIDLEQDLDKQRRGC